MSEQSSQRTQITVVLVRDNSSAAYPNALHAQQVVSNKEVTLEQYKSMLKDKGQVDTPLLAKLGYPVILVHTTPGRKCIPEVMFKPLSRNRENNRQATVAASRISTGLAEGCVVGNVYALRTDDKALTAAEWEVLVDYLDMIMDVYGDGHEYVNAELFQDLIKQVARAMHHRGLAEDPGTGKHCWNCSTDEADCDQLMKCANCKTALYCSKDCQRDDWRAGHKGRCKPAAT